MRQQGDETKLQDNLVPREISALLSNQRLILRETQRAVTPLGGVAVFVVFLQKLGLVEELRQHMPIQWKSPNQIDPTATFTAAFLLAVLAGAKALCPRLSPERIQLALMLNAGMWSPLKCGLFSLSRRPS